MSTVPIARILVVDDETDLVTALCRTLEAQGFSTTGTASGPQALEALRAAATVDTARFTRFSMNFKMRLPIVPSSCGWPRSPIRWQIRRSSGKCW
jgi:CheY-like chemotaxis protein